MIYIPEGIRVTPSQEAHINFLNHCSSHPYVRRNVYKFVRQISGKVIIKVLKNPKIKNDLEFDLIIGKCGKVSKYIPAFNRYC